MLGAPVGAADRPDRLSARQGRPGAGAAPWLLAGFLALGPVHWLPGIEPRVVDILKLILLLLGLVKVFATELSARRPPFPRGLLGPAGFAGLAVLWIPGLLRASSLHAAAGFLVSLCLSAVLFWCFYCLARQGDAVWVVFRRAALLVGALAAASLLNELSGNAIWPTTGRWIGVNFGGFGTRSSGWSIGLALFVPAFAMWIQTPRNEPCGRMPQTMRGSIGVAGCLVLLVTAVVSGGRTGLLIGMFTLVALLVLPCSRRLGAVLAAIVVFGAGSACLAGNCGSVVRAGDLSAVTPEAVVDAEPVEAVEAAAAVDQFLSRRLVGYVLAVQEFGGSPLLGNGLGHTLQADTRGEPVEVHNLWLNWAGETGVGAPLLFLAMASTVLRRGSGACRDEQRSETERHGVALLLIVVLSGLMASLLDVVLEGVVQSIWWAAAGVAVGIADRPAGSASTTPV